MKKKYLSIIAILIPILITSCGISLLNLGDGKGIQEYYTLKPINPPQTTSKHWCSNLTLQILPFNQANKFDRRILINKNNTTIKLYDSKRWINEPDQLLTDTFYKAILQTKLFKYVITSRSNIHPHCTLTANIINFDKKIDNNKITAQLTISFTMTQNDKNGKQNIIWEKLIQQSTPMTTEDNTEFIQAMNQNLQKTIKQIITEIQQITPIS